MPLVYSRPKLVLVVPLFLALTQCVDEAPVDDPGAATMSQQAPGVAQPRAGLTDIACTTDASCACLDTACARSVCDPTAQKCTLEPRAAEGTSCGAGNLCDNIGRCLPCSTDASSTYGLVQKNIFDSPVHGCNAQVCHGSSPGQALLDLSANVSYGQMINTPSTLS